MIYSKLDLFIRTLSYSDKAFLRHLMWGDGLEQHFLVRLVAKHPTIVTTWASTWAPGVELSFDEMMELSDGRFAQAARVYSNAPMHVVLSIASELLHYCIMLCSPAGDHVAPYALHNFEIDLRARL